MMAKPSVLLPEPFGPIKAWTSPRRISKLTPLRIGFSPTLTCRSMIESVSFMCFVEVMIRHASRGLSFAFTF